MPGTKPSRPRSMTRNGRLAPSSASTSSSWPATPSPKRILTGRWFRKAAIIALLSDRLDGISDGHVAGLDHIGVDAQAHLTVVLAPVGREHAQRVHITLAAAGVLGDQRAPLITVGDPQNGAADANIPTHPGVLLVGRRALDQERVSEAARIERLGKVGTGRE